MGDGLVVLWVFVGAEDWVGAVKGAVVRGERGTRNAAAAGCTGWVDGVT